jgi:hypothetical protein
LHHDFHDNLYLLLRGEKNIKIFSPAEAANMYTCGEVVRVHKNGRINYKGQLTHPDGSDEQSLIAIKAAADLEKASELLGLVDDDVDEEEGTTPYVCFHVFDTCIHYTYLYMYTYVYLNFLAERRMEQALEDLLDAEIAGNDDEDDDDDDDEDDDNNGMYTNVYLLVTI